MLAVIALAITILLIIFRRVGRYEIPIWGAMCLGAVIVLALGAINPSDALNAIDFEVILFLFGAFAIGRALEASGLLEEFAYKALGSAKNYDQLLLLVILGAGILSAVLMNDTLAVVGTPIAILIARKLGLSSKPFLFALAFAVTIGSVFSPIGNPQNLLIATKSNMQSPFLMFALYLLMPTLLNLGIAFAFIKYFFPLDKKLGELNISEKISMVRDKKLAKLSEISVAFFLVLIFIRIAAGLLGFEQTIPLALISVLAALPVLLLSERRLEIAKTLDWGTLVLFAAMFVLMQSVWNEGIFQSLVTSLSLDVKNIGAILAVSTIVSQFVSNVPFTALYLPLLSAAGAGMKEYLALAAGTTLAGNLTLIGAASNLIIAAGAEKRGEKIDFFEFAKVGAALTLANIIVVYLFLALL